jgi:hypothetical protein
MNIDTIHEPPLCFLLHRVTGVPYTELHHAIENLSSTEQDQLNKLAAEIISDARHIALAIV